MSRVCATWSSEMANSRFLQLDDLQLQRLEDSLLRKHFFVNDLDELRQRGLEQGLESHLTGRYLRACNVPWCERVVDLSRAKIAEVGCGTGPATVAFAQRAAKVIGGEYGQLEFETIWSLLPVRKH